LTNSDKKPLMRSLGEFVGHLYKAVRSDPNTSRRILNKTTQQQRRGTITLRRTTTDEIEIHDSKYPSP